MVRKVENRKLFEVDRGILLPMLWRQAIFCAALEGKYLHIYNQKGRLHYKLETYVLAAAFRAILLHF